MAHQKKALLIGCNYPSVPGAQLLGPCTDINQLAGLLKQYRYQDLVLLVDDRTLVDKSGGHSSSPHGLLNKLKHLVRCLPSGGPGHSGPKVRVDLPSKANIMRAIRWLVSNNAAGDKLFFAFAGHGVQQKDKSGTEADGFTECMVSGDLHAISDDVLNAALVRSIQRGVTLHVHLDACHSGTMLDLPFVCTGDPYASKWKQVEKPSEKGAVRGGTVVQFSSCLDAQTAADHGVSGGLGTKIFMISLQELVQSGRKFSYADVLDRMTHHAKMAKKTAGAARGQAGGAGNMADKALEKLHGGAAGKRIARLAASLRSKNQHQAQVPQLSASHKLDMRTAFQL